MKPGEIVRHKGEDGFFVVVGRGPGDVFNWFVVPLKKLEAGGYVRLASEKGRYVSIADLEKDLRAAVVEARLEDEI